MQHNFVEFQRIWFEPLYCLEFPGVKVKNLKFPKGILKKYVLTPSPPSPPLLPPGSPSSNLFFFWNSSFQLVLQNHFVHFQAKLPLLCSIYILFWAALTKMSSSGHHPTDSPLKMKKVRIWWSGGQHFPYLVHHFESSLSVHGINFFR